MKSNDEDDDDNDPVQVDFYGIRLSGSPQKGDVPDPDTWREVWREIHADLRGIVRNLFGILADTLKGVRNLIRGVGGLPPSYSRKVEAAHHLADAEESQPSGTNDNYVLAQRAERDLQMVMRRKQLEGYKVKVLDADGRVVFLFLPTMSDPEAASIADNVAKLMPEVSSDPEAASVGDNVAKPMSEGPVEPPLDKT